MSKQQRKRPWWIPAPLSESEQRERDAERELGLKLIKIGYKELTKFGTTDERARQLRKIRARLRQSLA